MISSIAPIIICLEGINTLFEKYSPDVLITRLQNFVPNKLSISLTNKCFCKYKYCYAKPDGKNVPEQGIMELGISDVERILEYAKKIGIHAINLTGGDPLAHSNFWDILDLCKKYEITVDLSTKKILTQYDIKKISDYSDRIQSFQFSIDSLYEEEAQKLVVPSCVKQVLDSMEQLIYAVGDRIKVKVNSVITAYNIGHLLDLSDVLFKMGVAEHGLSPYIFNLCTNDEHFFPTYEEYENLRRKITAYKHKEKLAYPISLGREEGKLDYALCTAGTEALIVNYDGEVYVCERFCANKDFSVGNIHENTLVEIWNSDRIKQFSYPSRRRFKGTECEKCEDFDYCIRERGICYVHSYILGGSMYSPDYFCKFREKLNMFRIY